MLASWTGSRAGTHRRLCNDDPPVRTGDSAQGCLRLPPRLPKGSGLLRELADKTVEGLVMKTFRNY